MFIVISNDLMELSRNILLVPDIEEFILYCKLLLKIKKFNFIWLIMVFNIIRSFNFFFQNCYESRRLNILLL